MPAASAAPVAAAAPAAEEAAEVRPVPRLAHVPANHHPTGKAQGEDRVQRQARVLRPRLQAQGHPRGQGARAQPHPYGCASAPSRSVLLRSPTNPQAKKFVESLPKVLKENLSKEDAEKLQKAFEAIGGVVKLE